jgi:hypothetical protein
MRKAFHHVWIGYMTGYLFSQANIYFNDKTEYLMWLDKNWPSFSPYFIVVIWLTCVLFYLGIIHSEDRRIDE